MKDQQRKRPYLLNNELTYSSLTSPSKKKKNHKLCKLFQRWRVLFFFRSQVQSAGGRSLSYLLSGLSLNKLPFISEQSISFFLKHVTMYTVDLTFCTLRSYHVCWSLLFEQGSFFCLSTPCSVSKMSQWPEMSQISYILLIPDNTIKFHKSLTSVECATNSNQIS